MIDVQTRRAAAIRDGQTLQSILTLQMRIGDRQGEIETRAALNALLWRMVDADLLPCIACGGDLTDGTTHYSWRDAAWRCLPEREGDQ